MGVDDRYKVSVGDSHDFQKQEEKLAQVNTSENAGKLSLEPTIVRSPEYPSNYSIIFPGGVVIEVDSTSGQERIHVFHPKGSLVNFNNDGDLHIRSFKDLIQAAKGNNIKQASGNETKNIGGDDTEVVGGNKSTNISGSQTLETGSTRDKTVGGDENDDIQGNKNETISGLLNIIVTGAVVLSGATVLLKGSGGAGTIKMGSGSGHKALMTTDLKTWLEEHTHDIQNAASGIVTLTSDGANETVGSDKQTSQTQAE